MTERSGTGRATRLSEDIARQLIRRISSGELKVGDRLPPERQLVETFGASRTVIREALQSLAARGLIESYVGRGTFVRHPTTQDLTEKLKLLLSGSSCPEEIRSARLLVEAEIAACAARHHTPQALEAIRQAAGTGHRSERFYDALALAGRCPVLAPILSALHALEPVADRAGEASGLRRLINAISRGDEDAARAAVRSRGRKIAAPPQA